MNEEYQSIIKNEVWEIIPRPKDKYVVTSKWIYKIKHATDGSIDKSKARFVARGFSQQEDIDYEETFAPTTRLKKALYGLKQAPRAWYARMDAYLQRLGFAKSYVDANLYVKVVKRELVIILLYVDDLLLTVWKGLDEIYLGQEKYVIKMLKRFDMMDCKSMTTAMITNLKRLRSFQSSPVDPSRYRQLIGSLMYLLNTRPNICFAVNILSQFQVEPKHDHWIATKHILRYLQGTLHDCLKCDWRNDVHLIGYIDSDWGGSEQDGRSTTGGCFSLGSSMTSWMSRKQDTIALSSAGAEYVATYEVSKEAMWLRKLLSDLFEGPMDPTVIHCDNTSCIRLAEDPIYYGKEKHITTFES
eukprot:PITA_36715